MRPQRLLPGPAAEVGPARSPCRDGGRRGPGRPTGGPRRPVDPRRRACVRCPPRGTARQSGPHLRQPDAPPGRLVRRRSGNRSGAVPGAEQQVAELADTALGVRLATRAGPAKPHGAASARAADRRLDHQGGVAVPEDRGPRPLERGPRRSLGLEHDPRPLTPQRRQAATICAALGLRASAGSVRTTSPRSSHWHPQGTSPVDTRAPDALHTHDQVSMSSATTFEASGDPRPRTEGAADRAFGDDSARRRDMTSYANPPSPVATVPDSVTTVPEQAEGGLGSTRYLPGIDGLRACAVIAVMIGHVSYQSTLNWPWLKGEWLGVTTFFTLSGFLIARILLVERAGTGATSLSKFWTRRAKRLLPALYARDPRDDVRDLAAHPARRLGPARPTSGNALLRQELVRTRTFTARTGRPCSSSGRCRSRSSSTSSAR